MNPSPMFAAARRLLAATLIGALAACGGGGGGGDEPAVPGTGSLGPGTSSVVSADGKVTVAVGDGALQASTRISIAAATPDAATAADASYVPGTTYAYTAPDLQVPEQVLITIASPSAVGETPAHPNAKFTAQAFPPGYVPPPTCLVNAPSVLNGSQTARNILVTTNSDAQPAQCPMAPAPGCTVVFNPGPQVAVCAPSQDVILAPSVAASCPPGYREVTGEADFAELAAANGFARVCLRNGNSTPPVLRGSDGSLFASCQASRGQFICSAPKLPSGVYSVLWDTEQPPDPTFNTKSTGGGTYVYKEELETGAVFRARIIASDPHGLGAAEILEVLDFPPELLGRGEANVRRVWAAPPSAFSGPSVTSYDTGNVLLPFENADLSPAAVNAQVTRRFIARVFDKAGNSNLSNPMIPLQFHVLRIGIDSFTVTPSSVQFPGGPVTLSWAVKGATSVSIDNGGGTTTVNDNVFNAATGSATVSVTGTTTFTLTATHPMRATKTAQVTVTLGADATPPSVTLAASPNPVVAPGSITLSATASDNAGVSKVEFYRGATLVGTDMTAPYSQAVSFTPADIGTVAFTAKAYDAANNTTTSAVVNVTVSPDTSAPSVSLLANPATVLAPGSTTLQATANDNIGVTKVEFYRGATLIATDLAAPFQANVDFTLADLGTASFTSKAYDAQNNSTISSVVSVLVTTPSTGDTYASPTGIDAGNTTCSQAAPCRSIAQAAATAQANKTVWLNNGDYTGTTQPAPIAIPAGLTLRALTPGLAGVGQQIVMQGSGTVVGIVLRRNGFGDWGSIAASAGNVTIDGVKAVAISTQGTGYPAVLTLSGSVHATMTPGNVADYTDQMPAVTQSVSIYATLADNAWLTVNGGLFGGAALGGSDGVSGAFNRGAFNLTGSSRLDLVNVVLNVESSGIFLYGAATQVNMTGSLLNAAANVGQGYGIYAAKGTPQVTLVDSEITDFDHAYSHGSAGIYVGTYAQPGVALTLTTTNSAVTANNLGVFVSELGSTASSLTWNGTGTSIQGNTHGGVACRDACAIDLAGGQVNGNATNDPTAGGNVFHGGIWMGLATRTHQLKLRNVQVKDNKSTVGSNANSSDNSGLTLAGNASSVYDLGTAASPGNNTIQGNTSSGQTTGINVNVAAGVTVNAVGNTFAPGVQGASTLGKYQLGTSPCGVSACSVSSGSGANYRVNSGALRLAQ